MMHGLLHGHSHRATLRVAVLGGLVLAALAACQAPRMQPDIYSPAAVEKIPGIVRAVEQRDTREYPALVAALENPDGSIRMFASYALHEITGQWKGYRYYDPPAQRAMGILNWQAWLREQGLTPVIVDTSQQAPAAIQ